MNRVKSGAKLTADTVTMVPNADPRPVSGEGQMNQVVAGMIDIMGRVSKAVADLNMIELGLEILAWRKGDIKSKLNGNGVLRRFSTATELPNKLLKHEGGTDKYRAALEGFNFFMVENSNYIQKISEKGFSEEPDCPYTVDTVGGYTEFLIRACKLMDNIVNLARNPESSSSS